MSFDRKWRQGATISTPELHLTLMYLENYSHLFLYAINLKWKATSCVSLVTYDVCVRMRRNTDIYGTL